MHVNIKKRKKKALRYDMKVEYAWFEKNNSGRKCC